MTDYISDVKSLIEGARDDINRLEDRINDAKMAKAAEEAPRRRVSGPTWRIIAFAACGIVGTLAMLWMTSIAASVDKIAENSGKSLDAQSRALSAQAERLAGVEAWRTATDGRLDRIDNGVVRIESKLDHALLK